MYDACSQARYTHKTVKYQELAANQLKGNVLMYYLCFEWCLVQFHSGNYICVFKKKKQIMYSIFACFSL